MRDETRQKVDKTKKWHATCKKVLVGEFFVFHMFAWFYSIVMLVKQKKNFFYENEQGLIKGTIN